MDLAIRFGRDLMQTRLFFGTSRATNPLSGSREIRTKLHSKLLESCISIQQRKIQTGTQLKPVAQTAVIPEKKAILPMVLRGQSGWHNILRNVLVIFAQEPTKNGEAERERQSNGPVLWKINGQKGIGRNLRDSLSAAAQSKH